MISTRLTYVEWIALRRAARASGQLLATFQRDAINQHVSAVLARSTLMEERHAAAASGN